MRSAIPLLFSISLLGIGVTGAFAQGDGWYTEGDFAPKVRVKLEIVNTLDFDRKNCPLEEATASRRKPTATSSTANMTISTMMALGTSFSS